MEKKNVRITKAQRFADIIALLNGESPSNGTDISTAVEVLEHELEILANKNKGENRKPTATQVENEKHKNSIVEFLATLPNDSEGVTCTEILKSIPDFADFSNQKVSALMRQLKDEKRAVSAEHRGKTLFHLA